jgi:rare lipoprotein A
MGTTYYPTETYNYVETGIASWYGPGFHGSKTASGEKYDQNELTAAHRTLQMPSLVRVTNLSNGRSVVVRVNDRGPFAKGRIIDVSAKAANLLGMVGTGTARVELELLADESRALAHAAKGGTPTKGVEVAYNQTGQLPVGYQTPPPYIPPTGPVISDIPTTEADMTMAAQHDNVQGHYDSGRFYPNPVVEQREVSPTRLYVQAGAFGQQDNALRLSEKLSSIGNTTVEPVQYSGRTLYKVRIGPLDSVRAADTVLSKVLASGQSDAIIVVQ